jgi:hypothetical protein
MSGGSLSFSIAALSTEAETSERMLLRVADAAPGVVFYDVLDGVPVRVHGGTPSPLERIASADKPPHAGESIARFPSDLLWLFEDHGDLLLPAYEGAESLSVGERSRTIASLESMLAIVDEHLADAEFVSEAEPETMQFLKDLRGWLGIALSERLPLVVS